MPRRLGQIVARGRQRWLVRVFLGRDRETRSRRYHNRTVHGTARRAQEYLTKMLRERDLGRGLEGSEITLNDYLAKWLETAAKPKLREKSYRSYESLLRRYVRPLLGERILSAITPLDVQAAYQEMIGRISPRTIRYAHSVFRSAMRQAVRWRLLLQDPTEGTQLPRLGRREMRVLSAEQSRIFLEAALKTHYGPVFAVALTTGMRPSEYLALKWSSDIDFDRGTVSVIRTLERTAGRWRFAETKRARSRRVIKLQNWVLELLKALQSRTSRQSNCHLHDAADLIFITAAGRPIHSDKLAKRFKAILHQAGLPTLRLYDLRHTAATLSLAAGVPPKVVAEQLGHASAAFTLDAYSHVLPHMQTGAASRVEALLFPQSRSVSNRKSPQRAGHPVRKQEAVS